MCCFSETVTHVSATRIFARPAEHGRQVLAYAMTVGAARDLAMILPLPVPIGVDDHAVRFISLEGYPEFFDDMAKAFPAPASFSVSGGMPSRLAAPQPRLVVHRVGAFVASFVPRVADFVRLDPRFRLSPSVLDALPTYADHGFAVFQLAKLERTPKPRHPMAFEFPRRDPSSIFFPTLHVHDGHVPDHATFDHTLYLQCADGVKPAPLPTRVYDPDGTQREWTQDWLSTFVPISTYVDIGRTAGLVHPTATVYSLGLGGPLANRDTVVFPAS